MQYSIDELKDLLVMCLERYEEAMQKQPIDKEASAIINDWVKANGDEILKDHHDYLVYISNEADKNEWYGYSGY